MRHVLLLLPLLFAQLPAPLFLEGTTLPPQFTLTFSNGIGCEVAKPSPYRKPYSLVGGGAGALHQAYAQIV